MGVGTAVAAACAHGLEEAISSMVGRTKGQADCRVLQRAPQAHGGWSSEQGGAKSNQSHVGIETSPLLLLNAL